MIHLNVPAYCINLDHRTDRWDKAQEQFSKMAWPVRRVSALTHKDCPDSKLTPGQAGCMESHKKTWKMISEDDSDLAAVFEDDVVFPSDFEEIFPKAFDELPVDWKVWHLHSFGPSQMKNLTVLGKYITKLNNKGWGSHGYLIKKDFTREALRISSEITNQNIDMLLTHGISIKGFSSYGILPQHTLCFQRGEDTDIPETKQNSYWSRMRRTYCR